MYCYNDNVNKIKQLITIQNVIDRYGYKPKKGFISCPFHNEKTPSLRVYTDTNTFYCFGCGTGGDVISFIAHLFKLDFSGSLLRLDNDFNLGLYLADKDRRKGIDDRFQIMQKEREKIERLKQMYRDHYYVVSYWFRCLWMQQKKLTPKTSDEMPHPLFLYALNHTDYLEYWLEEYNTFEKWKEVYG